MKKFFALCTMIVALGFVAGCTPKADTPANTTDTPAATDGHTDGDGHDHSAEGAADAT